MTTYLKKIMQPIEDLWAALEASGDRGGARRIGEHPGHDFYASIDDEGHRGLQILTGDQPPKPPEFDVVRILFGHRPDGRWLTSIWLEDSELSSVFAEVCQAMVFASQSVAPERLAAFTFARLLKWRRLLEAGKGEILGIIAIRALIGELLLLKQCLNLWTPEEVVKGWLGPVHAPQDFVLPSQLLEAKCVMRAASTVQINSIEQLDVPDEVKLTLGLVTLSASAPQGSHLFSLRSLVGEIRQLLAPAPLSMSEFDDKLSSAGYVDSEKYDEKLFRLQSIRFYRVGGQFPRLRRDGMSHHIVKATYEISIGSLEKYETELGR